jgi:hypothetical protein
MKRHSPYHVLLSLLLTLSCAFLVVRGATVTAYRGTEAAEYLLTWALQVHRLDAEAAVLAHLNLLWAYPLDAMRQCLERLVQHMRAPLLIMQPHVHKPVTAYMVRKSVSLHRRHANNRLDVLFGGTLATMYEVPTLRFSTKAFPPERYLPINLGPSSDSHSLTGFLRPLLGLNEAGSAICDDVTATKFLHLLERAVVNLLQSSSSHASSPLSTPSPPSEATNLNEEDTQQLHGRMRQLLDRKPLLQPCHHGHVKLQRSGLEFGCILKATLDVHLANYTTQLLSSPHNTPQSSSPIGQSDSSSRIIVNAPTPLPVFEHLSQLVEYLIRETVAAEEANQRSRIWAFLLLLGQVVQLLQPVDYPFLFYRHFFVRLLTKLKPFSSRQATEAVIKVRYVYVQQVQGVFEHLNL